MHVKTSLALHQSNITDVDDPMYLFISISKDVAEETIPVSSGSTKMIQLQFTDICKDVVIQRNPCRRKLKRQPIEKE